MQSSVVTLQRPNTAQLVADNAKLFLESGGYEEPLLMLASSQTELTTPRIMPRPLPGNRIEFPDPLRSITARRPERRLPGEYHETPAAPQLLAPVRQPEAIRTDAAPQPVRSGQIALQINTVPLHCDVIVDDRYVGQSPLTVYVDRSRNHVVQISRAGYEEKMKLLDAHFFENETKYILLERLELKK